MNGTATVEIDPNILHELIKCNDVKVLRASILNPTGKQICLIETNLLSPGYHGFIHLSLDDGGLKVQKG